MKIGEIIFLRKKRVELGEGHIIQYTLFEWKKLFSIIIYHWKTIKQNRFHSHAFPAYAFLLSGKYIEEVIENGKVVQKTVNQRFKPRFIPKKYIHRILRAEPRTWTIVFVGRWMDYWFEYFDNKKIWVKYSWGRKKIGTFEGDQTLNIFNNEYK